MRIKHRVIYILLCGLILLGCQSPKDNTQQPGATHTHSDKTAAKAMLYQEDSCCARVTTEAGATMSPEIARLWTSSFVKFHFNDCQADYSLSLPADMLEGLLNEDMAINGIRVYYGYNEAAATPQEKFLLMLTPFRINDTMYEDLSTNGSLLVLSKDANLNLTQMTTVQLQPYVDGWMQTLASSTVMDKAYAQAFSREVLEEAIEKSMQPGNSQMVYFHFALRSVAKFNQQYFKNKRRPSQILEQPALLLNFTLVSEKQSPDDFIDFTDFARPCPRFCGITVFNLGCQCALAK